MTVESFKWFHLLMTWFHPFLFHSFRLRGLLQLQIFIVNILISFPPHTNAFATFLLCQYICRTVQYSAVCTTNPGPRSPPCLSLAPLLLEHFTTLQRERQQTPKAGGCASRITADCCWLLLTAGVDCCDCCWLQSNSKRRQYIWNKQMKPASCLSTLI